MAINKGGRGKTAIDRHVVISVTIHPEVLRKLDLYKIAVKIPRSEIIELAVLDYLQKQKNIAANTL